MLFYNILYLCLLLFCLHGGTYASVKTFTSSNGSFSSERGTDGFYLHNLNMTYNIQVPNGRRAILSFTKFIVLGIMPNCSEDSVQIFVGCEKKRSVGKFCSCALATPLLFDIYSIDECISLTFMSDNEYAAPGFEVKYSSAPKNQSFSNKNTCSDTNQSYVGNIFTPLWPKNYPKDIDCTWTFETKPNNYTTVIQFMDFEIERSVFCDPSGEKDDRVKIEASKSENANSTEVIQMRICSQQTDINKRKIFSIVAKDYRKVFVKFINDKDNLTGPGFAAGFISYKSGITDLESCLYLITSTSPQMLLSTNLLFLVAFSLASNFSHLHWFVF